jgi:hypothetical protein
MLGRQTNKEFDLSGVRLTEGDIFVDYTPTHVPIKPGSVTISDTPLKTGFASANPVADPLTSDTFDVTADALLIASWALRTNSGGSPSSALDDTFVGSGAWTEVAREQSTGSNTLRLTTGYAQMGGSPGTGKVVTCDWGGTSVNVIRAGWIVTEAIGHDTTTPVAESAVDGNSAASSLSVSIADFTTGNLVYSAFCAYEATTATGSSGTGETQIGEVDSGGTFPIWLVAQKSTDTAHDASWSSGAARCAGTVIEFAASGGAPAVVKFRGLMMTGVGL